MKFITSTT